MFGKGEVGVECKGRVLGLLVERRIDIQWDPWNALSSPPTAQGHAQIWFWVNEMESYCLMSGPNFYSGSHHSSTDDSGMVPDNLCPTFLLNISCFKTLSCSAECLPSHLITLVIMLTRFSHKSAPCYSSIFAISYKGSPRIGSKMGTWNKHIIKEFSSMLVLIEFFSCHLEKLRVLKHFRKPLNIHSHSNANKKYWIFAPCAI